MRCHEMQRHRHPSDRYIQTWRRRCGRRSPAWLKYRLKSPGELLMTWSTSTVAVCCSSDSVSSSRALLLRLEQPRVLDGDHRLVGEGGDQLDLLIGKRAHLIAAERKGADCRPIAQERHAESTSVSCQFLIAGRPVFGIGQHVGNMDCPAFQYGSPGRAATIDGQGVLEPIPLSFAGVAKVGDQPQHISIPLKDDALVSRAKPRCRFGQRVEHSLQIEGGPADEFEHLGGRGLLLQRLVRARGLAARPLFLGRQRRNCDGARPLAHCGALASPSCGVAL